MSNGVKKDPKTIVRRKGVIERLQDQLKKGVKPVKGTTDTVALTEGDVKRINKELETLKSRIS